MIVVELLGDVHEDAVPLAAHALRSELRFDDPVARLGDFAFAAAVALAPGTSTGQSIEHHLAQAIESATDLRVRSAHEVASLDDSRDADEILRSALSKLLPE